MGESRIGLDPNLNCTNLKKQRHRHESPSQTETTLRSPGRCYALFLSFVQGGAQWANPLYVRGYQTYTNVAYVDPANSAILQVRTGGEGGMAHLGKMRSWSADQQNDLVNGTVTATYTFEDPNGDQLVLSAIGPSAFQPDGRITFNGVYTVIGGTGRYAEASGTLCYDGWARATDFATGQGIGFLNIEGGHLRRPGPYGRSQRES